MALTRKQIGERLREIREGIGFTQGHVADRLGLHRPAVSEIEAGRRAVTSEELYRFAELYATSVSRILTDPGPGADQAVEVLFRKQGGSTPATRSAIGRFVEQRRAERELEELLGLPKRVDTRPGYGATAPESKWDAIRQGNTIAEQERRRLDLGSAPVRDVTDLLERQGVRIGLVTAVDGEQLDGFYLETSDLGACIGVNLGRDDSTGFRSAFTAAHEYAHWLLRDRQVELFAFQESTDDLLEVRANSFAAAFLLPEAGLREYFAALGLLTGNRLAHLSPGDVIRAMDHFGASRQALLYRLVNVGLIDDRVRRALWDFPIGPVAEALGIGFGDRRFIATRLPMLAIHAWRRGLISASRAASLCELDLAGFKELMGQLGEDPEADPGSPLLGAAAG